MGKRVLSICTGMGLMDRAFMDAGFEVEPGCEIDAQKRAMYAAVCPERPHPIYYDLRDLVAWCKRDDYKHERGSDTYDGMRDKSDDAFDARLAESFGY